MLFKITINDSSEIFQILSSYIKVTNKKSNIEMIKAIRLSAKETILNNNKISEIISPVEEFIVTGSNKVFNEVIAIAIRIVF